MIAKYGSQSIVGTTKSVGNITSSTVNYIISTNSINHKNSINEVMQRVNGEDARVQQLVLTVTNTLSTLKASLAGVSNYLNSSDVNSKMLEIYGILNNDNQMMQMLFSEQQIMLLAASVQNLLAATSETSGTKQPSSPSDANNFEEITILDESQISQATHDAVLGYLGQDEFASNRGTNKRILSVGIPLGFTQRIKQKVNIQKQGRASFENRRNDIVNVCVYKVDMINSDIVYKPLKFMFELSRFPVKVSTSQWLPIPQKPSLSDIVNSIPTLNFSQNVDISTSTAITNGIEYASSVVAGADGIKNARVAFDDDSYSFLTVNQKASILNNHIVSQLLEAYIHLMTGLSVAESDFDMVDSMQPVDQTLVKTLLEHSMQHVSDVVKQKSTSTQSQSNVTGGVMFSTTNVRPTATSILQGSVSPLSITQSQLSNPSGIAGNVSLSSRLKNIQSANVPIKTLQQVTVTGNVGNNLSTISSRNAPVVAETLRTISSLSNTMSTISSPLAMNQKLINPKQFDRIFNVVVDPTAFDIDVARTTATPFGRQALNLMIKNGDVVPATENDVALSSTTQIGTNQITPGGRSFIQNRSSPNVNSWKYRDRDTNQGDVTADKYFITIETFDEGT
jgi:hypothetical protein